LKNIQVLDTQCINKMVKYVFLILELVYFETLDQFSHSSFKIHEFSHFNQILLSLFNISSTFYNSIWLNITTKMCQTV